jgi:hypothetical protein
LAIDAQIFSVHAMSVWDNVAKVSTIWWFSPSSAPSSGPMSFIPTA